MKAVLSFVLLAAAASHVASAFTIEFINNCDYTVWPAIGKAPSGVPDTSVAYGVELVSGNSTSFDIDDTETGIRAWGRTGCDDDGDNCETGACVGGLVCTDAGITAGVLMSEYGYADFGEEWGGERTSWDLSIVDSIINIDTRLNVTDGQNVACSSSSCASNQAYTSSTDYSADHNSDLGQTYSHTFCP